MKKLQTILSTLSLVIASHAMANGDSPQRSAIQQIYSAGTGCPNASVDADLSPNGKILTLRLDEWVIEFGPLVPMSSTRKYCRSSVMLDYPIGWSYAVADFEYSGYASLDAGVVGQFSLKTNFQGSANTAPNMKSFSGSSSGQFNDNFRLRSGMALPSNSNPDLATDSLSWSPCGVKRSLQLNNQAHLAAGSRLLRNARGILTVDSIDESPKIKYFLKWRRCL